METIYRTTASLSERRNLWADKPDSSGRGLDSIEYRRGQWSETQLVTTCIFLAMAYGSVKEVETQVLIAERLRYIDESSQRRACADDDRDRPPDQRPCQLA